MLGNHESVIFAYKKQGILSVMEKIMGAAVAQLR
jgi:hypothetical protein